jgi:hypothetical protein
MANGSEGHLRLRTASGTRSRKKRLDSERSGWNQAAKKTLDKCRAARSINLLLQYLGSDQQSIL